VGTLTEIHDFLRLLFSHLGTLHCPACRREVHATSIPEMVREVFLSWPQGTRLFILAPLGESKEREIPNLVRKLKRDGFARIRINGEILDLDHSRTCLEDPSIRWTWWWIDSFWIPKTSAPYRFHRAVVRNRGTAGQGPFPRGGGEGFQ